MEVFTTLKKNNKGTTLTEMIVTFALTGIFLVAAAGILSSAVLIHGQLTATMNAQNVGEMLLDKITGEMSSKKGEVLVQDGLLVIHYVEPATEGLTGNQTNQRVWKLDEKAYMGFRISDLQMVSLNDEDVIEVTLKIKNLKTGFEYTISKCTRCYAT